MKKVVGIKFKQGGKVYFFDPGFLQLKQKDMVVVETSQGEDIGEVDIEKREIDEEKFNKDIKKVIRIATNKDLKHAEKLKKKEKEAFEICQKKIKKYELPMNLVEVEFRFDDSKVIFYFTSETRVDFRDLVKELAAIYKTRIELRQIGVRDEVRKIGGNGICGRELCCCSFLKNCDMVSIKMAKEQNASLNPAKISGNCGRLMCCLRYEQEVYEEKNSRLPKIGDIVKTEDGEGTICDVETLKEIVNVQYKKEEGNSYKKYNASEVKVIKKSGAKEKKNMNSEELADLAELEKMEMLEKEEKKNKMSNSEM